MWKSNSLVQELNAGIETGGLVSVLALVKQILDDIWNVSKLYKYIGSENIDSLSSVYQLSIWLGFFIKRISTFVGYLTPNPFLCK